MKKTRREAVTCECGQEGVIYEVPKMDVVNPEIMKSWNIDDDVQMAVLSKSIIYNEPVDEE